MSDERIEVHVNIEGDIRQHPIHMLQELGITYADYKFTDEVWMFRGCQNVPEELPERITVVRLPA